MTKYSEQALDKIAKIFRDSNIKVIDVNVENAVLEILSNGKELPKNWAKPTFSPANHYKDALEVLGFFFGKEDWNITYHKDTEMFEVYVVDKKYSVASVSLARALMLAMYNYHLLKEKN